MNLTSLSFCFAVSLLAGAFGCSSAAPSSSDTAPLTGGQRAPASEPAPPPVVAQLPGAATPPKPVVPPSKFPHCASKDHALAAANARVVAHRAACSSEEIALASGSWTYTEASFHEEKQELQFAFIAGIGAACQACIEEATSVATPAAPTPPFAAGSEVNPYPCIAARTDLGCATKIAEQRECFQSDCGACLDANEWGACVDDAIARGACVKVPTDCKTAFEQSNASQCLYGAKADELLVSAAIAQTTFIAETLCGP